MRHIAYVIVDCKVIKMERINECQLELKQWDCLRKKYSYVVIAKMSHRLTETKETLFRTNICALSWSSVVCRRIICNFGVLHIVEYYNCCWGDTCIIFSSYNFTDHTYHTYLPVYKVYNIQLFAFKIVHDDVCHPILEKVYTTFI